MITVLTGENSYALTAALDELSAAFIAQYGDIAVERLDGASASVERIRESLQSSPFLAPRKLVVLRRPSSNKQFIDDAETILTSVADTTDVALVEPIIDKRTSYYKWLKNQADLKEFPELDELGLARWLVTAAQAHGGTISPSDARLLVARIGTNQQLVASELDKLVTYDPHVTRDTIALLTEPTPQGKIFDLLDAALAGDARRALELYKDQRAQRVDPSQIVAMIAWQLRVLSIMKAAGNRTAAEIAREAKLSPYVVQKSESLADRLSVGKLRALIDSLLVLDVRSKRERIDLDEALQNYLLVLAGR